MEDYIIRMSAGNGSVRAFFAYTKNTVGQAQRLHSLSPVATAALGRLLTGAAIMGAMLKNDQDILTITAKGDGPLKGIVVTADNKVNVKGYVYEPIVDLPLKPSGKLDVGGAIGQGVLTVIKDMGLKEPMSGQVPLVSGEIADDLTYYFAKSEQIPSSVALGVLVDTDYSCKEAGGFIIQLMPDTPEEVISVIEKKLPYLEPVTTLLDKGNSPEDIMKMILEDLDIIFYEKTPVNFKCDCDRTRVEKALISVGKEELKDMLENDKNANLRCHFCNKEYDFTENDLKELLEKI
ncbi:Hsp33 family molecular chaperone HslO [Anaeropeptidivorans aminofermentans]|uniref:Hsp33 family molecular chaperone HslO n=1 Tax=Anaeropeptidivorans aminofermentans TaxID=2934315 RepID=UPI0020258050|nr:Hsp33 family molecular chaperone HslO [Anaeropeptidivorans aminofermentans]